MSTAIKFTQELKDKWVAALRSGKYRQTYSALHEIKNKRCSYCALGLLCHVAGLKAKRADGWNGLMEYAKGKIFSIESLINLPGEAQKQVVVLNDAKRARFKTIANFVEQNISAEA